ncbi:hypothetical protein Lal_00033330 [Lupinus albus]|nr:hypothetical protein Lal_00033330 [Lupinus albus]
MHSNNQGYREALWCYVGRSTIEAIYLLRRLIKRYTRNQRDLHMDLEKAYDKVSRKVLWKALEKKSVRIKCVRIINDMHDRVKNSSFAMTFRNPHITYSHLASLHTQYGYISTSG